MIDVFPGKSPFSHPLATGYLIENKVAIDAPEGILYPNPEMIILTHEHCDHITGITAHSCKICASPVAAKEMEIGHSFCKELGLPEIRDAKIRPLKDNELLKFPDFTKPNVRSSCHPPALDVRFTLRILHTPGHCPGAICIYLEEKKYLFSGDTVFPDLMLPNLALPRSDPFLLLQSYERLSKLKIEKFFPGHGEPFSASGYMEDVTEALKALLQP